MKIFIDGSGWNGKESKYMIALEDGQSWGDTFGIERTNNEMEYQALLDLLIHSHPFNVGQDDEILSDSQLVVNQVNGKWKVKEPRLFPLCQKAQRLLKERGCILKWIPREENKAGHLLGR